MVQSNSSEEMSKGDEYLLNLFLTDEGIADPAIWYKKLRDESPVFRSSSGAIFLSRYEDCRMVFRDNRLGKDNREGPCLLYTSPSPRDLDLSRMPSCA